MIKIQMGDQSIEGIATIALATKEDSTVTVAVEASMANQIRMLVNLESYIYSNLCHMHNLDPNDEQTLLFFSKLKERAIGVGGEPK